MSAPYFKAYNMRSYNIFIEMDIICLYYRMNKECFAMEMLNSVLVEFDLRPTYYDDFRCLAGGCHLNCCKGWRITVDKKEFVSMKRRIGSPEFNQRMSHTLRRLRSGAVGDAIYGEIRLKEDGVCPMQCENGLCILQLEKGHEALPFVCRSFPRMEMALPSGYLERTLSPACEAVLELLWNLPEGIDFCSDPLPVGQITKASLGPHGFLNEHFQEIRSRCIDFLQDRRIALPQRILLMGMALKSLADGEKDISRWLTRADLLSDQFISDGNTLNGDHEPTLHKFLANNTRLLSALPVKEDGFKALAEEVIGALILVGTTESGTSRATVSSVPYKEARDRFRERFGSHDYFMENLMVALFFHLHFPILDSPEELWKSYVNFCNLYSIYQFMAVMSCREATAGDKDELFRHLVYTSRNMIHNEKVQAAVRDLMYLNDSTTLAHLSVLLSG